jgi:DNA-directed RNA polymerase I, II, and III subunit RPABC1
MENAIKTVREMIIQRGYKIDIEDDIKIIGIDINSEKIVVFKIPVVKFNVEKFKEYTNLLNKMGNNHCIIIYTESVTSVPKKLVKNCLDVNTELFTQEELQYNITKHRLVPLHTRLDETDKKHFIEKYGIKFPVILLSDPISRFYDYKVDDIIKITKINSGGTFINYRIVKS